jgi:hypothetical protein
MRNYTAEIRHYKLKYGKISSSNFRRKEKIAKKIIQLKEKQLLTN